MGGVCRRDAAPSWEEGQEPTLPRHGWQCSLAKARAQSAPLVLQGRWSAILACSGDDAPSAHEVLRDDRFA